MMPSTFILPRVKACRSCAAAKLKCEPDSASGYTRCKRCRAQNTECILSDPTPRKRRKYLPEVRPYTITELARGIAHYRKCMSHYFPFIVLPAEDQASHLLDRKPFLCLVVAMLGCTKDRSRQHVLEVEGRQYLGLHVLQNGEKSLDLLQGLLIYVYWYHLQFELTNDRRIVYLHLAMAMVVDLELNKSPFVRYRRKKPLEIASGYDYGYSDNAERRRDHTFEEKRAFLGCVYVTSVKSKSVVNMDALQFSEYVDSCCEQLEGSGMSSDGDLVHMVRLQQIVEKFEFARNALSRISRAGVWSSGLNTHTDATSHVRTWSCALTTFWQHVPIQAKTEFLQIQYYYASICLHEIGLEDASFQNDEERLEVLHGCLTSIKMHHCTFLPMSSQPLILMDMPSHLFPQGNHATFVAVQLCSVRCANWLGTLVEEELRLVDVFDKLVQTFDQFLDTYASYEIPEFFIRIAPIAKGVQSWYRTRLRALNDAEAIKEAPLVPEDQVDLNFLGQFLNLDDSLWLQDIFDNDSRAFNGSGTK